MNFIGKFFIITFGAFASVFLGIYLFRLMNGNITFIGLSDVYYYFNNNSIDTFNTLEALTNEINNSISNFDLKIQAFNDIASPFNSQLPFLVQLAIMLGQFFTKFFDFFIAFGRIVMLPITTLYYTLQFIVGVLVYIFKFLQYVATYQGSTLPNFTSFVCQVKQGV